MHQRVRCLNFRSLAAEETMDIFVGGNGRLVGGLNPSEKYEHHVMWHDDIPNISGKIKNVPNHQPEYFCCVFRHGDGQ